MNDGVTLKLLPVCECGHVFTKLKIKEAKCNINKKNYYARHIIIPYQCPNCGKIIEDILVDTNIFEDE